MGYEPQKFFVGVIDLFSVLLPGAVLTYVLKDDLGKIFLAKSTNDLPQNTEGWVVFLITSYLLGHFIFLIGASLLDEHMYEPIKQASYAEQIKRLAKGKKLSTFWARLAARMLLKKDIGQPVRHAVKIKEHYLNPMNASEAINAFQWSKARLQLKYPEAIASVQRFEADSKFFRSLIIVLCILLPRNLLEPNYPFAICCVPLLVLAFWRYFDQRSKAMNQAYWYIITLESERKSGYRELSSSQAGGFSHAGGVVYRVARSRVEYLLVTARKDLHEWVLPKGHISPGEPIRETAVREVREEAGVWARIKSTLGESSYMLNGEAIKVQFYLMEALKEEMPSDRGREHVWLAWDEVLKQAGRAEHQDMLKLAQQSLTQKDSAAKASSAAAS
jgi:ADP-ribose pyrophosphatase YjhB (NUDIX family)